LAAPVHLHLVASGNAEEGIGKFGGACQLLNSDNRLKCC